MIHKKAAIETAKIVGFSILFPLALWAIFSLFSPVVIGLALAVAVLAYVVHRIYWHQVFLQVQKENE